jgi:hypothetical protein
MRSRARWAALILAVAAAACPVVVPLVLDNPFGRQTPRTLRIVHAMREWAPAPGLAVLVVAAALAAGLWRPSRPRGRAAIVLLTALTAGAAWLTGRNVFEWMFAPLPRPTFVAAADASFVTEAERVIAVEIGGDAAAYPILQLAYHHVVQDVVGGTPLAVTY